MPETRLGAWKAIGLLALLVVVVLVPLAPSLRSARRPEEWTTATPTFAGRAVCAECHAEAVEAWKGSDHDRAMEEATEATVLGDFDDAVFEHEGVTSRFYRREGRYFVHTEGPGGEPGEFEIAYTFGYDPLQQYLIRFPRGRLQALSVAWDVPGQRWFHLYPDRKIPPDDWLHWTRNGQNWNGMCAACHSTRLRKNFDAKSDSFTTTWFEIDVSCEACHGPGSRHVAWAKVEPMARPDVEHKGLIVPTSGLTAEEQVELCAPCHSRRSELGTWEHAGVELLDHMVPSLLREGLYHADGQILDEVYVYGSFVQSKMYQKGIRCSDCHDVHSTKLHNEGNALCTRCHQAEAYDSAGHHFHKKEVEGKPSDGALCVKCHMPERNYMVVDPRADHSLRVPRPDLTQAIGTPNACEGCHDDKPLEWSVDAYRKWYGEARKPHFGSVLAAARAGRPEAAELLVRLAADPLHPAIVRATALTLLARYPGEASERVLRDALGSPDAAVRHAAVHTLRPPDPQAQVETLAPLLFDPVRAVRTLAASRLAGVPPERLKPYQRRALETALEEFRTDVESTLDFPQGGLNLGNLHSQLGEPKKAEEYYRQAIAVDDLFFPAKQNLAVLLNTQGRNREAETLLRQILEAYPDNYEAAYSLGLLLVEMERSSAAVEWIERAAKGMPGHARLHYNLALLLQQLGRLDDAERSFKNGLVAAPYDLDLMVAIADHYLKRGRAKDALAWADRIIAAHPDQEIGKQIKAVALRARAQSGR
ncbi:MAG: tetratricopeptide repeat protein [Planctomycetota bacterium]